jgi:hypothetical protein
MVSYVSSNIHLHDTLHHTFAFINIHLDIHRIIISITNKLASVSKEKAAILCFAVYTKKGRCFSPMAQKYKFRPHQSISYISKIILQSETQLYNISYKLSQEFFELFLQIIRASPASLELCPFTLQLQLRLGQPV